MGLQENTGGPIPVIVLGGYVTVLGTIRCLGWRGIRSFCVGPVDRYITCSRFHHRPPAEGLPAPTPEDLAAYLEHLPLESAVLMPCADDWVLAVAQLPEELRRRFPSSQSSREVLATLLDKEGLRRVLERFDIPRPRTLPVDSGEDLRAVDWKGGESWFLKPTDSAAFRRRFGVKAFRVGGSSEAQRLFETIRSAGLDCVLQEYIPGGADQHWFVDGFIDRKGRWKGLFARRRLRIHPPDFGDSSCMVSVPVEEVQEAVESCRRLLEGMGYRGIFSAEFKRDPRDGSLKLIEVNARPWAYVQFAGACGINAPWMAYLDALGREVPAPAGYPVGRRFLFWPADLFAAWEQWKKGELSLGRWMGSWWGAQQAVFRWDDPGPAVVQNLQLTRAALGRLGSSGGRAVSDGRSS